VRRALAWALVLPWAVWAFGRLLGLERGFPLVPIMAYAPYAAAASLVCLLVVLALRRYGPAVVGGAATAVLAGVLVARVQADPGTDAGAAAGPRLTILEANLHRGRVPARALVAMVRRTGADVLAVAELKHAEDRALTAAGLGDVLPSRVSHPRSDAGGTALYARARLQPLPRPHTSAETSAALVRVRGAPPAELYAVHPDSPTSPSSVSRWRRDLRALPPAATPGALRILAGDFNATLDHHELRRLLITGYEDAADEAGKGLTPTWPSGRVLPPPVTIDHVLADVRCGVASHRVLSLPGSDHRATLTTLVLPGVRLTRTRKLVRAPTSP
jgi:endonuclease/exonuclease/phosphatase (EEP) superfamily protein YafD